MTTNPPSIAKSAATDSVNADSNTAKNDQTDRAISFKWLVVLGLISLSLIAFYYFNFGYRLEMGFGTQNDFGAFGDFLGGVLNPILGFATVALLIWSLKMQRDELTLTRQELKETKEETALSRQAMQDQVEHLQKEAKLNEIIRLLNDLRTKINHHLSQPLLDTSYIHCDFYCYGIHQKFTTFSGILSHRLKTVDSKGYWYIRRSQRETFNSIGEKVSFQNRNQQSWCELERLVIIFSHLILKYNRISPSEEFNSVYSHIAHDYLAPLCETLRTEALIKAMQDLGFEFEPEPEPEPTP